MGLLDLPASFLSWADGGLALMLPATARVLVWGVIAGIVSLGLYWLLSPQKRIAGIVAEEQVYKARLRDETVDVEDGRAAAGALLGLALKRMGLVIPPVAIAALPVVGLMAWLQAHYTPDLDYIAVGPDWVRGWEVPFLVALLAASLLFKVLFHIR